MAELYTWPGILTTLLERRDLSVSESTWAMRQIMSGAATPSQLSGFLIALRAKGETALRRHLDAQIGVTHRVLVESNDLGRTEHFTQMRFAAPIEPGVIVDVTVTGHDGRQLLAA